MPRAESKRQGIQCLLTLHNSVVSRDSLGSNVLHSMSKNAGKNSLGQEERIKHGGEIRTRRGAGKDGRDLWRQEVDSEISDEFDLLDEGQIRDDAEKLLRRQRLQKLETARYSELMAATKDARDKADDDDEPLSVIQILEKLLVADFFLITISLMWFLTGVIQRSITKDSSLLEAWLKLWEPLFQPALGIFMAGTLLSGISKKLEKKS